MDDHIQGSQQNTHSPKEKFPKIITHKWKFGNLLEAPNTLPMKGLFVTKLQNDPQFWCLCSLWWFTQVGVLLSPIALKVVGPLLLDSNSSRDGTHPHFQYPIQPLTNKETKGQTITKDQKNEMKGKLIEF